jgi:hypothetical protein
MREVSNHWVACCVSFHSRITHLQHSIARRRLTLLFVCVPGGEGGRGGRQG